MNPQRVNSSAYGTRKHQTRHHTTSQTKCVMYQSTASASPVCGRGLCATISQRSSATSPSRWPAAIRRADFYGSPQRSHLPRDHLCLLPAIGQGSYNRRVGGPGPQRTAPLLSRCAEGTGRESATAEERPNEVPRDGPMNHYQFGYSTFKPKMHISKIKFKTPRENLAA